MPALVRLGADLFLLACFKEAPKCRQRRALRRAALYVPAVAARGLLGALWEVLSLHRWQNGPRGLSALRATCEKQRQAWVVQRTARMRAYSTDLKERLVRAVADGQPTPRA